MSKLKKKKKSKSVINHLRQNHLIYLLSCETFLCVFPWDGVLACMSVGV